MMKFGSNLTSGSGSTGNRLLANGTDVANPNFTHPTQPSSNNPLCNTCSNSVGICCPPTVECDDSDGKCPLYALEMSHNTLNGYLIAQVMNSSAPVAGRKKMRALVRPSHGKQNKSSKEGEGGAMKNGKSQRRKAHRKQF